MTYFIYDKAAFIAALFYLTHLSTYANTLDTIECSIKKQDIVLKIENDSPLSLALKTNTSSEYNQKVNSGKTTFILGLEQFPVKLDNHISSETWEISKSCEITKE
ncbi:conserved exported hypothetical protein [Vibrio chagasii]|nr:conserved exported hypothetical protein [Vibrio chagasii]CAH6956324.1 conserved exported hypothetical protein [Vibrio chagasii]CAH7094098.1 conserved exported hypothetical protein [Vibrio chagasii]CAH7110948.1 conserved exported hypothetical protein [Vibrio chagasii]CAH7133060.1 conserved exported hypothetical protein [Vibrio chagasii]